MSTWKVLSGAVAVSVAVAVIAVWGFGVGADAQVRFPQRPRRPMAGTATQPVFRPPPATQWSAPKQAADTTLLRELPRQALMIASVEHRRRPAVDRSVDFAGTTEASPSSCTSEFRRGRQPSLRVVVQDPQGKAVKTLDLPAPALTHDTPDYGKIAATVEGWIDADFAPLLGTPATRPATTPDATVPADVEAMLNRVDPQAAFLAVRRLHTLIDASGESAENLAALVRGYTHLGESTRFLYSRHNSVFFARALIYAQRLTRRYPDAVVAHAARGYALTLLGLAAEGRTELETARKSGGLPAWATLVDDLNHFRTRDLVDRGAANEPTSTLARYFALLTVEHSGMQAIVVNLGRLALKDDPAAIRVVNILADNGGVSLQHEVTPLYWPTLFNSLAGLAKEPDVPPAVKSAAAAVDLRRAASPLGVLAAMDAEPSEGGQLLTWGTYASINRDAMYVAAMRRAFFESKMLAAGDATSVRGVWPLVKDHRFAPVLAGFDPSGTPGGREAAVDVESFSGDELIRRMPHLLEHEKRLDAKHPERKWIENYDYADDNTAYDQAVILRAWQGKEVDAIAMLGLIKGQTGEQLSALSPDHPSAVAELIVNRWPATKARAAQIEQDLGGHPQVAFALARAYRSDGRLDDARRLLQSAIDISPDPAAYQELADLYKEQGNVDKWLEINEKYLSTTEDFGLDHARRNEEMANQLMAMKRPDRALPYAKAAADSYSAWGLRVYANCLALLGRFDEGEQVERARQERYPESFAWYRWCQLTGKGDLAAARAASAATAEEVARSDDDDSLNEAAVYFLMEGDAKRAESCWSKCYPQPWVTLQLALIALERGDTDKARELCERTANAQDPSQQLPPQLAAMVGNVTPSDSSRAQAYAAAAAEIVRCLDDPKAAPARDAPTVIDPKAVGKAYRGMTAFFLGRFCELRGQKDDALWWYRTARDNPEWTYTCLPQTAAGLRRLGDSYFR